MTPYREVLVLSKPREAAPSCDGAVSFLEWRLVVRHNDYVRRRIDDISVRWSWISPFRSRVYKCSGLTILLEIGSVRSGCRKFRSSRRVYVRLHGKRRASEQRRATQKAKRQRAVPQHISHEQVLSSHSSKGSNKTTIGRFPS
jgi:hypothetical protein